MKLLKIGSSSSNNIVLHSDFVSSYHGCMTSTKVNRTNIFSCNQLLHPYRH